MFVCEGTDVPVELDVVTKTDEVELLPAGAGLLMLVRLVAVVLDTMEPEVLTSCTDVVLLLSCLGVAVATAVAKIKD